MKWKQIHGGEERTFAVVFDKGDEVVEGLAAFAREQRLTASRLTGLGAFSDAVLGFFDWERKDYRRIPIEEQVEVVALIGDIALDEGGEPRLHPHVVVSKADGTAHGGHLLAAHARPTLEVLVIESPAHLRRRMDAETGLPLISL